MPPRTYTVEINTFKGACVLVALASIAVCMITPDERWLLGLVTVFGINTVLALSHFKEDRLRYEGWMVFVMVLFIAITDESIPHEGYAWLQFVMCIGLAMTFPELRERWSQFFGRALRWIRPE